jgi:hypothetical protein
MTKAIDHQDKMLIETILREADQWGLRYEVTRDAKRYLEEGTVDDEVEAYIWAYEEWIK